MQKKRPGSGSVRIELQAPDVGISSCLESKSRVHSSKALVGALGP